MDARFLRPDHGGACFDAIPALVERLLTEPAQHEKVVLVWVDALGWRFVERHGGHPFLRRIADEGRLDRWTSQFPSTTTAAVATMHSGLPVAQHGLYEWFQYEPALDRIVCPLRLCFAGDTQPGTLLAHPGAEALLPQVETVYQRLARSGVTSHCFQHESYTRGPAVQIAFAGAHVHPYASVESALDLLAETLAGPGPMHCFIYIDEVDAAGHEAGPDAVAFDAAIVRVLDLLERWHARVAHRCGDAVLLLTADHGMAHTDPATTVYVNRVWPEIAAHLRTGADDRPLVPAGSARDLFLHAARGHADALVAGLSDLIGERAEVHRVDELLAAGLFGPDPSSRLRERVGDVVVLPFDGESAWWWEPGRFEQRFRGHHGGLTAAEIEIPLARLRL